MLIPSTHQTKILLTTSRRAFVTGSSVAVGDSIVATTQTTHDDAVSQLLNCYALASRALFQEKYGDAWRICQTALPLVDNMADEAIKANPDLVKAAAMVLFMRARDSMDDFSAQGEQQTMRDYDRLIKIAPKSLEAERLQALLVTEFKISVAQAFRDLPMSGTDEPRVQLDETMQVEPHQSDVGTEMAHWSHDNMTLFGSSAKSSRVSMDDAPPAKLKR